MGTRLVCTAYGTVLKANSVQAGFSLLPAGLMHALISPVACHFHDAKVTVNAAVIFAVSNRNEMSVQSESESPRAPLSSEKHIIASTRVSMFKGRKVTPRLTGSSARSPTLPDDFGLTHSEPSGLSIIPRPCNEEETLDHLPRNQVATLENDDTMVM